MIEVIINDKKISVEKGKTILQIAKDNDIEIKTLCFMENCLNVNRCGTCMVEIEGTGEIVHACSTLAEDGMLIRTNSERANEKVKENISKNS